MRTHTLVFVMNSVLHPEVFLHRSTKWNLIRTANTRVIDPDKLQLVSVILLHTDQSTRVEEKNRSHSSSPLLRANETKAAIIDMNNVLHIRLSVRQSCQDGCGSCGYTGDRGLGWSAIFTNHSITANVSLVTALQRACRNSVNSNRV